MSGNVRFGIWGAGMIADFHAQAIGLNPRAELLAVCSRDPVKTASLAERYGAPHRFTDPGEMLSLKELDVVCICLPSGMHEAAAVAAANAGKHIFCEKPLDITLDKIDRIIDAAARNNVKLGCSHQRRTMPEAIAARKAIREGKLGKMVLGDAYLKYYRSPEYYKTAGWRGTWQHDGGGALMNQGIHGIDLLQWMMDDIASVFAHTAARVHDIEVEDTAVVAVKFANGAFGVIQGATSVYPGQATRFELHGERGSLIFGDAGIQTWEVRDGAVPQPAGSEAASPGSDPKSFSIEGHRMLIADMIDAIADDREPLVNGAEARKAVAVIMAIYESSRTGREVFL